LEIQNPQLTGKKRLGRAPAESAPCFEKIDLNPGAPFLARFLREKWAVMAEKSLNARQNY